MTIRESNADKGGCVPGYGQPGSHSVTAGGASGAGSGATGGASGARKGGAASGASGGGAVQTFRWLVKQMGVSTLFFLAIFAVVIVVINLTLTRVDVLDENALLPYSEILPNSTAIYMLVMGIIMPLYLEILLGQGATRRQFAVGLLGASVLFACALALVNAVIALAFADATLLSIPRWALANWFPFLAGWIIVIGYQYRRVITGFASTLIGVCLLTLSPLWPSYFNFNGMVPTLLGSVPALLSVAIGFAASLVLAVIILVLTRRIPIKV